jgi:N6-adenosine-specific RNA methylase IME4
VAVIPFPPGRFGAILVDCPWPFATWSPRGRDRSPDKHYQTMTFDELAALPIGSLAADDCALFMWTVWPQLDMARALIDAWGFTYKTAGFVWVKTNKDGRPFKGLGYWTRANTEPCLFATRGKPKRRARDVSQVIMTPRDRHSAKPTEIRGRIERLVDGPYLELFARERSPGWTSWGDQLPEEE